MNLDSIYKEVFFSGIDIEETDFQYRQLGMINFVLYLSSAIYIFFAYINFFLRDNIFLGIIDFLFLFPSIYVVITLRKNHNIERAALFTTILLFTSMSAILFVSQGGELSLLWSFLFSFLAFIINGYKRGIIYVFLFYGIIFFSLYNWIGESIKEVEFVRYISVTIVMSFLAFLYERGVSRALSQLRSVRDKLENTNKELNVTYQNLITTKEEIEEIHDYDTQQQELAKKKQNDLIANQLLKDPNFSVISFYHSSDILSGDMYSIYKLDNNRIFYFVIDGQGHGILPSLTTFSVASTISNNSHHLNDLETLNQKILSNLKTVLGENEQLSFTFILLDLENHEVVYSIGGMYATFIQTDSQIIELSSNNIPAIPYSDELIISKASIKGFQKIISYTDGLVEEKFNNKTICPKELLQDEKTLKETISSLDTRTTADDVTIVYISLT